jgi:DNA-binding NtrC family response regulator
MTQGTLRDSSQAGEKPARLAILVVDDEPLILWSLRKALVTRGHEVVTAGTAAEAVTALTGAAQPFSVVVLDYRLPDRQDLTLLEDVRRTSPASAVLMMTAFADDGMRAGALERGVRAVVDKPFLVKSFVSLIESVSS